MSVLVPIKSVIDPDVHVFPGNSAGKVCASSPKRVINPFCEVALEAAIQLREQGHVDRVDVISFGDINTQAQLRDALALGADNATLIQLETPLSALDMARALAKIVKEKSYRLAILGKQSIDDEENQVAAMLAGLLDWPQALNIHELSLQSDQLRVVQEYSGSLRTLSLTLPAVLSVDLALNTPRYARLPDIMQAKRKAIDLFNASDLKMTFTESTQYLEVVALPSRGPAQQFSSVEDLLAVLKPILQEIK